MATEQLITRDNFTSFLVRSTAGRTGTPDGNIFLDTTNDTVQIITSSELATFDMTSVGLGASEANPLSDTDKIQALALYFFIIQEVQADTALQNFRFSMDAVSNRMGKLVGATAFLNSIKLADGAINIAGVGGSLGDDRLKLADSGLQEFAASNGGGSDIDRILHGAKSLNTIDAGSQPFYMISASLSEAHRQAATPVDFSKAGSVNELIQTFGSTGNTPSDAGAGNFDSLADVLILGVRDYGFSIGEVNSVGTGVAELGAYSQGYGLGNTAVSDVASITQADVWGGGQISPFTGIGFTRLAAPEVVSGWVEANGNFTDKITNSAGASLIQLRAFMDMLMQQDTDQNDNTGATGAWIPKRAEPLYTIDPAGKLVSRQGLMIENIPAIDEQGAIMTDDAGDEKNRPVITSVIVALSTAWLLDTLGWLRLMYNDGAAAADFDTSGAVTVQDASSVAVALQATAFLSAMDVNTILWQSGTTVRITFNGTPSLAALQTVAKITLTSATNTVHNGTFIVTAFDDGADWIEVTNPLVIDATDDELTDSPAVADVVDYDDRIFAVTGGYELRFSYAYATNTQAGLSAGINKDVVLQVGGVDKTKSKTFTFTIGDTALNFDGSTDAETN